MRHRPPATRPARCSKLALPQSARSLLAAEPRRISIESAKLATPSSPSSSPATQGPPHRCYPYARARERPAAVPSVAEQQRHARAAAGARGSPGSGGGGSRGGPPAGDRDLHRRGRLHHGRRRRGSARGAQLRHLALPLPLLLPPLLLPLPLLPPLPLPASPRGAAGPCSCMTGGGPAASPASRLRRAQVASRCSVFIPTGCLSGSCGICEVGGASSTATPAPSFGTHACPRQQRPAPAAPQTPLAALATGPRPACRPRAPPCPAQVEVSKLEAGSSQDPSPAVIRACIAKVPPGYTALEVRRPCCAPAARGGGRRTRSAPSCWRACRLWPCCALRQCRHWASGPPPGDRIAEGRRLTAARLVPPLPPAPQVRNMEDAIWGQDGFDT